MNIYQMTFAQLEHYLLEIGENPAKAAFIYKGLYKMQITTLAALPALNETFKQQLASDFELTLPRLVEQSEDHDSAKLLFALSDNSLIEAVVMHQKYGNSLCISTQVGCNMGCSFCQSGRFKKVRNLETWEMVAQLLAVQKALELKISNVVLMGIGEPFDNYDQVMAFIEIISNQRGLSIGMRHITLSTCGIVPRIYDYMLHESHGLLAVSLHAPDNALRDQLMPINRLYPLETLMEAVNIYSQTTHKKVMLEYVMLYKINDSTKQAQQLADLIGDSNCYLNLIPYNETENLAFQKSPFERILAFYDVLKKNHITVTMRREFGASVKAACGQLRADYENH